ncbi:hypothetical protein [Paenibacillus nasutitermitis]|uniref:Uncharacterized protein n=1 Tax=Paenibacillus nasutitermitis TaxID=1652958 RepID=A0A917DYS9_9BACL|nr:hypothetical protein [Paenibacillus nasutitermitis]GGD81624.1 hypothetical protein GCM10010911_44680 [Paenibacillus nasutitermitis]
MNREELTAIFENMTPDKNQKERMRDSLRHRQQPAEHAKQPLRPLRVQWAALAIGILLALVVFLSYPFGEKISAYAIDVKIGQDGAVFRLADNQKSSEDFGTAVSNVNARPGLEFFIDGENIAKIEISTKNEYIYAVDWTKTQDEKFWNPNIYQTFDEERQVSEADFNLLYDKHMAMTFDDDFHDYGKIWYRWTAWNMYNWAAADNYSHFLGAGSNQGNPDTQEKSILAAGDDGSGIGHMQLEGYPDQLKEDKITIIITDRQGNRTTKVINVKVSNNELRQTVVTASLANS